MIPPPFPPPQRGRVRVGGRFPKNLMENYITLGTFDGVHLGHNSVVKSLIRHSLKAGCRSLVVYFKQSPKSVLSGKSGLITLPEERAGLLRGLGADAAEPLEFTPEMASMDHRRFFKEVLLKRFRMRGLLAGRDFAFGKNRKGDVRFLRRACKTAGVRLKILPFVTSGGHKISSSAVRVLLKNGDIRTANRWLGRHYEVAGKVIKGAGIGRLLGFPTANIAAAPSKILPPGVFAVKVRLGRDMYFGVANVGVRPTIGSLGGKLLLEAHILDFSRMIYGRILKVEFLKRIRGERRFAGREALQSRILKDIAAARKFILRR